MNDADIGVLAGRVPGKFKNDYDALICVMLECLEHLTPIFPIEATRAFLTAKRYWFDGISCEADMDYAVAECWAYIKRHEATGDSYTREYWSVRAVLCVLSSKAESADPTDYFEWFIEVILRMKHVPAGVISVLRASTQAGHVKRKR